MTPLYLATSGRALQPGVMLFKYSSYWHSWSRILSPRGVEAPGLVVEVDCWDRNGLRIERYKLANIRVHRTPYDDNDRFMTQLPTEVVDVMLKAYGYHDFRRIMDPNLMSLIDVDLAQRHSNGGAPFYTCMRDNPHADLIS